MNIPVDQLIEALDDKIVRTNQGSFVRVDDLRQLEKEIREARQEEEAKPKPKTFAAAREMAKRDPNLQPPPQAPRAPALSGVKGVGATEEDKR